VFCRPIEHTPPNTLQAAAEGAGTHDSADHSNGDAAAAPAASHSTRQASARPEHARGHRPQGHDCARAGTGLPPAAQREASALSGPGAAQGDVRDLPNIALGVHRTTTIPATSDQLTVAEPLEAGRVRILRAVADVDAPGAEAIRRIDGHASHNTTSSTRLPRSPHAARGVVHRADIAERERGRSLWCRHGLRGRRLARRVGSLRCTPCATTDNSPTGASPRGWMAN